MGNSNTTESQQILDAYLAHFPEDRAELMLLQEQLADQEDVRTRKNFRGHITAGAVVLNPERTAILMIHHRILDAWFQPGGHLELEDIDVLASARREVQEETGLRDIEQIVLFGDPSIPLVIETHYIPASPSKGEPEHYHHDYRYLFIAGTDGMSPQLQEVHASEWVFLDDKRLDSLGMALPRLRALKIV